IRMKIIMLEGSPNRNGSSNMLAEEFAKGAREAGHEVVIISAAHSKINPCIGCVSCGYDGPCVQKDDMEQIKQDILSADVMVFVTPLYYYGISAQLKTLIDRFCAFNGSIQRKHMKSALLAVAWNSDDWTMTALVEHYKTLVRYLNFKDMGMVLGCGCGTPDMTRNSKYPKMAYELGKGLSN
ncbi:MAG: flavodoxin family protein, partial [Candidatus Fimousia sp.]